MKLFSYYLQILLPLPVIYFIHEIQPSSTVFLIMVLVYYIIYRGLVDGFRLQKLGLLEKGSLWKMFVPFYGFRRKYFKATLSNPEPN